jgi:hypothetical protein
MVNMCSSFDFIEQHAFDMSEKIRKDSIYKFVRVEVSDSSGLNQVHDINECVQISDTRHALITKVILEDKDGNQYFVEPTPDGLRFAKGEITYKEYGKRQKRETLNIVSFFFMAVGLISTVMLTVKWFFI